MAHAKKGKVLTFLCLLMVLAFCLPRYQVQAADSEMKIYAMYLGNEDKGDSVLLESKGHYLLMDIGVASHADAIIRQLRALNVTNVDIYFSHLHGDHVGTAKGDFLGGLKALNSAGINIQKMYLPARELAPLSVSNEAKYQRLEEFMRDKGSIAYLKVGDTFQVGDAVGKVYGPVGVNTLDPNDYAGMSGGDEETEDNVKYTYYENNCSLVTMVTCGNTKYFTAGDCLIDEANLLVKTYGNALDADIMKLCHHGTGSGNTEDLVNAVSPKYSFASNTGLAGINQKTNKWETKTAIKYASANGMCYMVANERSTLIYDVKNDAVRMYKGNTVSTGQLLTGWQVLSGADGMCRKTDRYYLDANGVPVTGVQYLDGHYMYFGKGGCMEYGNFTEDGAYQYWKSYDEGRRYYTFSPDNNFSYMTVGFRDVGDKLYYFDANGIKLEGNGKTERIQIGNNYYAVGQSGAITRGGWSTIGSGKYYFGTDGAMKTNYKVKIGKNYYLFGSDGKMIKSSSGKKIVTLAGKKYCVGTSGALTISDWATVSGKKYYFGKDGVQKKNCVVKIARKYYYFGKDGRMVCASGNYKLVTVGTKKYCVLYDGTLLTSKTATIGKATYYFGKTGQMQVNTKVKISKKYYYFDKNGKMVCNRIVKIKGKNYYFDRTGAMCVNKNVTVKGKHYYCNKSGIVTRKK